MRSMCGCGARLTTIRPPVASLRSSATLCSVRRVPACMTTPPFRTNMLITSQSLSAGPSRATRLRHGGAGDAQQHSGKTT
mmetsp:Transcript_4905/g.8403  ORF Transcript_4905/g.8403 Transcript_4905/m.8403 type:complete len:80 (-) Transcript_4905:453-692(-)